MNNRLSKRVQREKEAYNHRQLERSQLTKRLRHCYHYSTKEILKIVGAYAEPLSKGKILELGSTGWYTRLYFSGINVNNITSINISEAEIERGRWLSQKLNIQVNFQVMDIHEMEFRDQSFDSVFGRAIIHHLQVEKGLKEINRILRPGGIAIFEEPLNINPIFKIYRFFNKHQRTADEEALRLKELNLIKKFFNSRVYYLNFFSIPFGIVSSILFESPDNFLNKMGYYMDRVFTKIPFFKLWCSRAIIVGIKK